MIVSKSTTKDPEKLVEVLEKYEIERLVLVPTLLRSILLYLSLEKSQNYLRKLRTWVCSGETLSLTLACEFFDYFEEEKYILCNFYGSTEVMGDVTYFICESKKQLNALQKIPIGYPVDNTIIYILDKHFQPVKDGEIGELYVSGLNLAKGYVNGRDPHKFMENPLSADTKYSRLYQTGDFASVKKGIIFYEGRTDSQIKIRGNRVDLSEVEKLIATVESIEKVVVLCHNIGELNQTILAFTKIKSGYTITSTELESILKSLMVDYMVPRVILLESVPLLVNGKVDRQTLLKMFDDKESTQRTDDYEIEHDLLEGVPHDKLTAAKDLFQTIQNVLGTSVKGKINLKNSFYELGGNSLNSIYTVTELRKKGYFITITDFIKANDLEEVLFKLDSDTDTQSKQLFVEKNMGKSMTLKAIPLANDHKTDTIE